MLGTTIGLGLEQTPFNENESVQFSTPVKRFLSSSVIKWKLFNANEVIIYMSYLYSIGALIWFKHINIFLANWPGTVINTLLYK